MERDLEIKGDPGCSSRFGFEQKDNRVTSVLKGSVAQRAGIKIGDVVLSVDSEPPTDAGYPAEIYEKQLKVPIKLKRGEKIIRTEISAKLACD